MSSTAFSPLLGLPWRSINTPHQYIYAVYAVRLLTSFIQATSSQPLLQFYHHAFQYYHHSLQYHHRSTSLLLDLTMVQLTYASLSLIAITFNQVLLPTLASRIFPRDF